MERWSKVVTDDDGLPAGHSGLEIAAVWGVARVSARMAVGGRREMEWEIDGGAKNVMVGGAADGRGGADVSHLGCRWYKRRRMVHEAGSLGLGLGDEDIGHRKMGYCVHAFDAVVVTVGSKPEPALLRYLSSSACTPGHAMFAWKGSAPWWQRKLRMTAPSCFDAGGLG